MRRVERVIAVLGSTSVGKSALTMRFVSNVFPTEYDPTIFRRYTHQISSHGIDYDLVLYDTAGLEQQPQISHQFINSNGFILVYSIADAQSFEIVRDIYDRLADELNKENIPVVLIGNKSDLADRRVVSYEQGQKLAKSMNAGFYETSARLGSNVRDGFVALLNSIDNRNSNNNNINNNSNMDTNNVNTNANNTNNSNSNSSKTNRNHVNLDQINNNNTTTTTTNKNTTNSQGQKANQQSLGDNGKRCVIC